MTEEIKRIYKNVSAVYDGQPWHGDNLVTSLSGISADMAVARPAKLNHSIAEIVCHMTAWRYFAVEKMKGNAAYEVWDTELNWQKITTLDEKEWKAIQDDLRKCQHQLLQQIDKMQESMLTATVDGRKYNFRLLLQGIAQHDIYHSGQIAIIRKLVS
jgi:uncharacterized damage-inducible protein DinB